LINQEKLKIFEGIKRLQAVGYFEPAQILCPDALRLSGNPARRFTGQGRQAGAMPLVTLVNLQLTK
jgi:hypothetical protein